ncbi:MAG: DUF5819 family protein [Crocinitomicaceae bacterium]|nr:hypothetical protein [Crocinitomicaceae bacterium]
MPDSAKMTVSPYLEPLFTQRWSMFYPCPVAEGKFKMKFYFEDDTTGWVYPTKEDYKWYKILRFSHHGELTLLESNMAFYVIRDIHDLGWEIGELKTQNIEDFRQKGSYRMVKNYAKAIAVKRKGEDPIRVDVICELHEVINDTRGELVFPPYTWNK